MTPFGPTHTSGNSQLREQRRAQPRPLRPRTAGTGSGRTSSAPVRTYQPSQLHLYVPAPCCPQCPGPQVKATFNIPDCCHRPVRDANES